jgi:glycosyltransferase involved in cell wall biosynthesis
MNHNPPTTIAFCITDLDPGGAECALVHIVTRLNRDEWSPHVFCLSGEGKLAGELRDAGVPVVCLGICRRWPFPAAFKLARELRRIRPAVLQTFLHHANIIGRWAGRRAGTPVIVSGVRVAERRSRFRLWLDRRTANWVDRHVCVSEGVADFSIQTGGLPRDKVVVIPNGVDFDRFANAKPADLAEFGLPPGHRSILSVGRLDPQKGVMVLLDAFTAVARELPDVHLILVGEGPLRPEIERFVSSHALADRVHLAGFRDDVPSLMKAGDCFVLASLWEGMPNVLLEALAAGLPVVGTAVEGVAELLADGERGRIVPPNDAGALSRALRETLTPPVAAAPPRVHPQPVSGNEFTWQAIAARYEQLYRDLLLEKSSEIAGDSR